MAIRRPQSSSAGPWFATAFLLLGLGLAGGVSAGEFKVSPILQSVPPGETMATYRLQNTGNRSVTVQISGLRWSQDQGQRRLSETETLLVVPPLVTVAPGDTQLVRVALEKPRRERELPFRLQFEEIPSRAPSGQIMVRTALLVDVPLFFAVESVQADVHWTLSRAGDGSLVLAGENRGGAHARFTALLLKRPDGEVLASRRGPAYLLPGNKTSWEFDDIEKISPKLVLEVEAERTRTRYVLAVD